MSPQERDRFDALMDEVVESLPPRLAELLEEVPVIVLDEPTPQMLRDLGIEPSDAAAMDELCGLHTGVALTERSVEHDADLPTQVHLFRRGIIALAGGWTEHKETDDEGTFLVGGEDAIYEEIRITLLHELGHHFGLDEDDLAKLGYD